MKITCSGTRGNIWVGTSWIFTVPSVPGVNAASGPPLKGEGRLRFTSSFIPSPIISLFTAGFFSFFFFLCLGPCGALFASGDETTGPEGPAWGGHARWALRKPSRWPPWPLPLRILRRSAPLCAAAQPWWIRFPPIACTGSPAEPTDKLFSAGGLAGRGLGEEGGGGLSVLGRSLPLPLGYERGWLSGSRIPFKCKKSVGNCQTGWLMSDNCSGVHKKCGPSGEPSMARKHTSAGGRGPCRVDTPAGFASASWGSAVAVGRFPGDRRARCKSAPHHRLPPGPAEALYRPGAGCGALPARRGPALGRHHRGQTSSRVAFERVMVPWRDHTAESIPEMFWWLQLFLLLI